MDDVGADISGQVLRESTIDGCEHPLDVWFVGRGAGSGLGDTDL